MAAVLSERENSLQLNDESSSSEYVNGADQAVRINPISTSIIFNAKNANGEIELRPNGPVLGGEDHAEVVVTSIAEKFPLKIKIEEAEEDDCVGVRLHEVGGQNLVARATSKEETFERDKIDKGDGPFRCEDCSVAFWNKEAYLEHQSEHIHDGPIVCLDTDSKWDDLLVSTDGGQKTLCCALCGQKFLNSKGFFNHQLKHQNQAVNQSSGFGEGMVKEKLYECKDCGKTFSNPGQCLNHQRSHKQASKSVFHQLDNLKKKSFQCPTCGRSYSRASALDAHRHCHEVKLVKSKIFETADKPPSLNEAPGQAEDLDTSPKQTVDDQQKVFHCVCGKSYRSLCGLGTHQRFSKGCSGGQVVKVREKKKHPFECSECEKTFVSAIALSTHQRWHKRRSVCNGQPNICKECGRSFTSLAFLNRHHKMAHSKELPAKSFLHQVCQLQKKAFECQECGCRFSRMSALQSHQLIHTDVFRNVMKDSETSPLKACQVDGIDDIASGTSTFLQDVAQTQIPEEYCNVIDVDTVDVDYKIVQITTPDNEGSSAQDQNPDLELVCESDQEEKDDMSFSLVQRAESTPSSVQLSPEIDVTIVKIDYELLNSEALKNDVIMSKNHPEYKCPQCDKAFDKLFSMYGHMKCHKKTVPKKSITDQLANQQKDNSKIGESELSFSSESVLLSHQQEVHRTAEKSFVCLRCNKICLSSSGLSNHQNLWCGKKTGINNAKNEKAMNFNPTKSLLGPKVHHCKKCGKGFWSLGAFYHHKQYHTQCADVGSTRPVMEHTHIRRKKKHRGRRCGIKRQFMNKKYDCNVCGKTYHMLGCFLKHMRAHDTGGLDVKSFDYQLEKLKKNSYQCPDCGKCFSRAMALQFHMRSHGIDFSDLQPAVKSFDHQGKKLYSYQCLECGMGCSDAMALEFHIKTHGFETVTTSAKLSPEKVQCNADFPSESLLHGHQKSFSKPTNNADETEHVESCQKLEDTLACEPESEKEQTTHLAKLKFKCQDCSRSFSFNGALNSHKRTHRKGFVSKQLKAKSVKQVSTMMPKQSLVKTPFACVECGRYFNTNSALGTHRRWHADKRFAKFLSKSYKRNTRKSVDGGPYLCNLCGKGFFYLCVLRRHQINHLKAETQQQEQVEAKEGFACPDCQMSFLSGSALTTHFAECHGKLAETTNLQSEVSYTLKSGPPIEIQSESNIANQEKPKTKCHKCSLCNKRFVSERGLRSHNWQKHLQIGKQLAVPHKNQKPSHESLVSNVKSYKEEEPFQHSQILDVTTKYFFKCDKCAKDFPSEKLLIAHKQLAKSRPHSCALCCRGFWSESQLQQHLAWHDEVRRRLPTELRYRLSSSMAQSISTSNVRSTYQLQTLANPQRYKCQHCGDVFLSLCALQDHLAVHKSEEPYHCSQCPQTFRHIRDLIDHHQDCLGDKERKDSKDLCPETSDENMACIECGITFEEETDLHQHYIEHAQGVI